MKRNELLFHVDNKGQLTLILVGDVPYSDSVAPYQQSDMRATLSSDKSMRLFFLLADSVALTNNTIIMLPVSE